MVNWNNNRCLYESSNQFCHKLKGSLIFVNRTDAFRSYTTRYLSNLRYFIKTCWQSFEEVGNHQKQHTCNELNALLCDEQVTTIELAFYAKVITFEGSTILDGPPEFLYYCVASSKRFFPNIFILPSGHLRPRPWGSPRHDFDLVRTLASHGM